MAKYGATFWQKLCDSIHKYLPLGWSVSFLEENRQPSGHHHVLLAVDTVDGRISLTISVRAEFDQLHGFQRLEMMRQAGRHYAEGIVEYYKAVKEGKYDESPTIPVDASE